MKKLFHGDFFRLLLLLTLFATTGFSQDEFPTGDADLTSEDAEILSKQLYKDPQDELGDADGARLIPPAHDISKYENWKLKIKSQPLSQDSCQSFAVAYAVDILNRNGYHSSTFIWDLLSYGRVQSGTTYCLRGCSECKPGFSIVRAMKAAETGLPSEEEYSQNNCGAIRPVFNPRNSTKYKSGFIWFNEKKFNPNIDYPANEITVDKAVQVIKEKILNGNPVLISIDSTEFPQYSGGVFKNPDTPSDYREALWHAMTVVGYDDDREGGAFKVANSWGNWGDREDAGYMWISYTAFKSRTRLMAFLSLDTNQRNFAWNPPNILGNDGSGNKIKSNSRIGIFQIELLERPSDNTPICLDANIWYPEKSKNQIIVYRCHEENKLLDNQKWDVILKEQKNGENFYILKSFAEQYKNQVLAIREGKLILEDQKVEFDENQLWLLRWSPVTNRRSIAWAGKGGEFILQVDQTKLEKYSDENAPEASVVLEIFNNLPRQSWRLKDAIINSPKSLNQ